MVLPHSPQNNYSLEIFWQVRIHFGQDHAQTNVEISFSVLKSVELYNALWYHVSSFV